ncbi:hypothetical protein N7475_004803 [Penicillium sp. IBT 31633x]|nr:hypothetical protein N7475_004803 [Penicillium sp. IBT 31633x]
MDAGNHPQNPENIDPNYLWPLIPLADLDETSQAKLVGLVQSMLEKDLRSCVKHCLQYYFPEASPKVELWSPTKSLLQSISLQGPHQDSQSNIHALAVLAYRSGQPRIIVADEATKRQLSGDHLRRCDLEGVVSVILISAEESNGSGSISIYGRRVTCYAGPGTDSLNFIQRDKDPQKHFGCTNIAWDPLWDPPFKLKHIKVRDPDQEVLAPDSLILGRETLVKAMTDTLSDYLPMELVMEISNTHGSPFKVPVWERRPSNTHILIFVLYHTTTAELCKTQRKIHNAIPFVFPRRNMIPQSQMKPGLGKEIIRDVGRSEMTVELIPWDRHRIRTRRDLLGFWNKYRLWDVGVRSIKFMPLIYLSKPFSSLDSAQFGVVRNQCAHMPFPVSIADMSLHDVCLEITTLNHIEAFTIYKLRDTEPAEILWHPDQQFYSVPPLWVLMDHRLGHVLVFLTNKLTENDFQELKQDLAGVGSSHINGEPPVPEHFAFSWKQGEAGTVDGKVKDIWDFLAEIYTSSWDRHCPSSFFCIDAQLAVDQTVIVVKSDFYDYPGHERLWHLPFPRLRGFHFIRIPRQLINSWEALHEHEGWLKYRRPGWPSPGVLPDDPDEGGYVEGDSFP